MSGCGHLPDGSFEHASNCHCFDTGKRKHFSVQLYQRIEVCVLANNEDEAEKLARENAGEIDWSFAEVEEARAEECYNDEYSHLVQEFKDEGRFIE
jgi:hypothetical protein